MRGHSAKIPSATSPWRTPHNASGSLLAQPFRPLACMCVPDLYFGGPPGVHVIPQPSVLGQRVLPSCTGARCEPPERIRPTGSPALSLSACGSKQPRPCCRLSESCQSTKGALLVRMGGTDGRLASNIQGPAACDRHGHPSTYECGQRKVAKLGIWLQSWCCIALR